ncbi:rna-binding fus [Fusarium heterosporum]|uniref:Rna-binding fus n=1 Tax=Fusarium heterosporum TaxID=42747 RepID=A0A8H5TQR9_FUSHE|nr:rna-binding fus [Fusarium heterosporum]
MDEFAPPSGPPPPKAPEVPAGWAVRWNDQYKEWFYVNVYTKKSQWDKPTAPVFPADDGAPSGPPPGYDGGNSHIPTDTKKNPYEDPHSQSAGGSYQDEDAKLAAKLQAEEDARARSGPGGPNVPSGYGASSSPYPQSNSPYPQDNNPYSQQQQQQQQQGGSSYPSELPPRDRGAKSGGFLGKLLGKGKQMAAGQQQHGGGYGGGYPQQQSYGQQSHGYPGQGPPMGYGAQPHYGGGGYGGYGGAPGYGGGGMMGGGPGYGGGGMMGGGRKPGGGGMGMMGGAAMGAGAGLLGGALIANAMDDDDEREAYQDGYQDGADYDDGGGDDGGD